MSKGNALVESFKTASTLLAYRIVAPSTSTANTVGYPSATTLMPIGVTTDQAFNSVVPVQMNGIGKVYCNDTITAGGLVKSDTSGRGVLFTPAVTSTSSTLACAYVGRLVGAAVAATGTIADVAILPGYSR